MLENWINPLPSKAFFKKGTHLSIKTSANSEDFNSAIPPKIALIGYGEFMPFIREAFYKLELSSFVDSFVDLGDARNNDQSLMSDAYKELISQNIFPIVLDSSVNPSISIANALKSLKSENNFGLICPDTSSSSQAYSLFSRLLENDKVKSLSFLAYQKHFANPSNQVIPKINLANLMSLGKIRDDITSAEPILRGLSSIAFDVGSIRACDSIGLSNSRNIGLFSEEACQLLQYAASSTALKGVHLFGFKLEDNNSRKIGAELIACLIWYIINGRLNANSLVSSKKNMTCYIVELEDGKQQLQFWKDDKSQRWWLEIPNMKEEKSLIPCDEKDYNLACENKMSDRLFHLLAR